MGPNRRAQERERAAARAKAEAARAEAERKAAAEAEKIVAVWNARQAGGRALWFYPTIGAAIAAGFPWLTYSCPACRQFGSVDLRTLDRHLGDRAMGLEGIVSKRRDRPYRSRRSPKSPERTSRPGQDLIRGRSPSLSSTQMARHRYCPKEHCQKDNGRALVGTKRGWRASNRASTRASAAPSRLLHRRTTARTDVAPRDALAVGALFE